MKMLNLDKNEKYLLACSFGPDSMALFYALLNEGYNFAVAHVNYHLRSESIQETSGLIKYCEKNNIQLYIKDVKECLGNSNIEEKCREIRYAFFDAICKQYNINYVLVAHNQDDHIETYLLQKDRKGIVNHFGLTYDTCMKDIHYVRPLLNYKKSYLYDTCITNNVPFGIDQSNFDTTKFKRNKIRAEIVSKLNDEDRLKYLNEIEHENVLLTKLFNLAKDNQNCDIQSFLTLDKKIQQIILYGKAKLILPEYELSSKLADQIIKILVSPKTNVIYKINKNLIFVKTYGEYVFTHNKEINYCYQLNEPSCLNTPYFYLNFTKDASNRNISMSDYPLTIRNAYSTDVIEVKNYTSKVNRLFIDWKVPVYLRNRWPIILNKEGKPIYIPRYQKNFKLSKDINFYVKF